MPQPLHGSDQRSSDYPYHHLILLKPFAQPTLLGFPPFSGILWVKRFKHDHLVSHDPVAVSPQSLGRSSGVDRHPASLQRDICPMPESITGRLGDLAVVPSRHAEWPFPSGADIRRLSYRPVIAAATGPDHARPLVGTQLAESCRAGKRSDMPEDALPPIRIGAQADRGFLHSGSK